VHEILTADGWNLWDDVSIAQYFPGWKLLFTEQSKKNDGHPTNPCKLSVMIDWGGRGAITPMMNPGSRGCHFSPLHFTAPAGGRWSIQFLSLFVPQQFDEQIKSPAVAD
jgi:hypothetical protein